MVYKKYIRKTRKSRKKFRKSKRKSSLKLMYKIAKKVYNRNTETKTVDVQFDTPLNQTGDYWYPVVPWNRDNNGIYQYHLEIPQGTGDGDRVGRKIVLTGINIDVVFFLTANGGAAGS